MKNNLYFLYLFLFTLVIGNKVSATTHTVQVGNYYFNPNTLNVEVGDTVKWIWVQGSHTTTSTTIPSGAATWDHPINSGSTSYSYKVTVAGTFNYKCTPHAAMGHLGSFTATAPAPALSVSPSSQNVTSSAGNTTFNVISNSSWTASSNQSWCTVTPSGNGNGSIVATYSANTSTTARSATITISVTGLAPQTVTVNQAGAPATLSVTPANQDVTVTAGNTSFSVTSNSSWTAQSDASWCTTTPSGSGNGAITATYTENTAWEKRTANITVTVSGLPPVVVTVTQDASTVGIEKRELEGVSVYPNPADNFVKLSFPASTDADLVVMDLNGSVLYSQILSGNLQYQVPVNTLRPGMYFFRISNSEGVSVRRIIINR